MDFEATEEMMRDVGNALSKTFPMMGFAFILFEFGEPGIGNYISNGCREDMIKALRETADRIENNQDIPAIQGRA